MNPLGLQPERFEIVEDEDGRLVGCCQLEQLPEDKTVSLRTLIVRPDMRYIDPLLSSLKQEETLRPLPLHCAVTQSMA